MTKKKLLADARKSLTEREYFESSSFRNHLASMFKFMTRCKKKLIIKLYGVDDGSTACTDGKMLTLNWKNPIQKTFPTLKLKILSVLGMFYHEVGHMLYTDFDTSFKYVKKISKDGTISVNVDSSLSSKKQELEVFLQNRPAFKNYVADILHNIINIIEDIWMESKLTEEFGGSVKNAVIINRSKVTDEIPTLKKQIEAGYMNSCITINLLLVYASSGIIPNPHGLQTVHTDVVEKCKKYVNAGILSGNVWGRLIASTHILLCMWDMLVDEIEQREQQAKQQMQNGQSQNQGSNGSEGQSGSTDSSNGESAENGQNSRSENQSELDKAISEELQKQQKEQTQESSNKNEQARTSDHFRGEKPDKESAEQKSNFKNENGSQKESAKSPEDKSKGTGKNEKNSGNSSSQKGSDEKSDKDEASNENSASGNKDEMSDGSDSAGNAANDDNEQSAGSKKDSYEDSSGEKEGSKSDEPDVSNTDGNKNGTSDNSGNLYNEQSDGSQEKDSKDDNQSVNTDNDSGESQDMSEDSETDANSEEAIPESVKEIQELMRQLLENSPRFAETEGEVSEADQEGIVSYEDFENFSNDGIGEKIAKSLDECAEEKVNSELLKEKRNELVKEVADVPFTDIHKHVNFHINRHINVLESDIYQYNQMQGVLKYSKALQKALEHVLKMKNTGLLRKQWVGKGIDKNNLYNRQQKVFYKKNLPKTTDLAVSILIDQSGSMSGRNIREAVRMAVILEDFCRAFEIPLSIAGHCWSGCVEYDIYKDFDEIDSKDRYRLMQIYPRGCNRDGAALQFCGEHLLKRPEDKKLLILISDGQPNADGYSGERAKEDLKAIKKNLKNRGVELFAAAIDQDKEYIKAIYGDGFLDMSDLEKLPKTMVRLIESFMNI